MSVPIIGEAKSPQPQPKEPLIHLQKQKFNKEEKQKLLEAANKLIESLNEFKDSIKSDKPSVKNYVFLLIEQDKGTLNWKTASNVGSYVCAGLVHQYLINALRATIRK